MRTGLDMQCEVGTGWKDRLKRVDDDCGSLLSKNREHRMEWTRGEFCIDRGEVMFNGFLHLSRGLAVPTNPRPPLLPSRRAGKALAVTLDWVPLSYLDLLSFPDPGSRCLHRP